jgi:hypothetical protein
MDPLTGSLVYTRGMMGSFFRIELQCMSPRPAMHGQISSPPSIYKRALQQYPIYQVSIARQAIQILAFCAHELAPKSC